MEIKLSKTLKYLRQNNNKTQEDLAKHLGISSQAVSKWERDEGFPDITLLPKISAFFHVSVDELLGVDEISKQSRIDEITAEYNRIRRHIPLDPNYNLDEGIELLRNALCEIPGEFFFEQLLAADLSWKGKQISDTFEKTALFEEAISLCEDILSRSTEDRWRDSAKQILLVIYADLGMTDKACDLAYQMPTPYCTCEYMLTYILKGEALKNRVSLNAVLYYKIFRESVLKLFDDGIVAENMICEKELEISGITKKEFIKSLENVIINNSKF